MRSLYSCLQPATSGTSLSRPDECRLQRWKSALSMPATRETEINSEETGGDKKHISPPERSPWVITIGFVGVTVSAALPLCVKEIVRAVSVGVPRPR